MRSRADAVRLINRQLHDKAYRKPKETECSHYGAQELRQLMDFIYGVPTREDELILNWMEYQKLKSSGGRDESLHDEPHEYRCNQRAE